MGPKTGSPEHEPIGGAPKDLPAVMVWLGGQLGNDGKYADEVGANFPPLKGWKINIMPVLGDIELMEKLQPGLVPLAAGNRESKRQWKQWEHELGAPILFLLVPNYRPAFKESDQSPWLPQPVKREWITKTPVQSLIDRYETKKETPDGLRLRAAIIARTGYPPEIVPLSLRG
jgi:hypothetical protein